MSHLRPALVLTAFFIALTGVVFPGAVWAIANLVFPHQANGSLVRGAHGQVIGSELIGQAFSKPEYFHPRPSAAGAGYDGSNSGGTNLGPTSSKLIHGTPDDPATPDENESYLGFGDLAELYRAENGLPPNALIPADAATRSASGLDPHISPANAQLQAGRVARVRGLSLARVVELIDDHVARRLLGVLGEPRVNVLELNLALDGLK